MTVEALYRLSPSQEGILLQSLAAPGSGIFVEQVTWTLRTALDAALLEQAWNDVARRHAALRTGFVWRTLDEPLQFSLPHVRVPFVLRDLRGATPAAQAAELEAYLAADRARGFDLARAPMLRVAALCTADDAYQIVWTFHHIVLDGWCVPLIAGEVLACYEARRRGGQAALPPAPPYRDYITWLAGRDVARAEAYWRAALRGFLRPTPLGRSVAAPAPAAASAAGSYGEHEVALAEPATAGLLAAAQRRRLTLNTIAQGIWAILLARYSGARDVVFGNTVSGRPPELPGVEAMVGLFITTVPLRVEVEPEAALWPWLAALQARQLEQREHEFCSSGQIQRASELAGGLPLYESILVFENYAAASPASAAMPSTDVRAIGAQTSYPLALLVIPGRALRLRIIHHPGRIAGSEVARVADHFLRLLARVAEEPEPSLAALADAISPDEIPRITRIEARPASGGGAIRPLTPTEQVLHEIWSDVLGAARIGPDDSFFELGGHSLAVSRVLVQVQQRLQLELPVYQIVETPTIAALARWIDARGAGASPRRLPGCVVALEPRGHKPPLFLVHPAAGSPLCYAGVAQGLGGDRPIYGLQAPGLLDDEPPLDRAEALAERYVAALREVQPIGPYHLAGWSAGAPIAFEVARQLEAAGEVVGLLVMIDQGFSRSLGGRLSPGDVLSNVASLLSIFAMFELPRSYGEVRQLGRWLGVSLPESLALRRDRAAAAGFLRSVARDVVRSYRVFRANLRANERYRPRPFGGPVVVLRAQAGTKADDAALAALRRYCSAGVHVVEIDGNHMTAVLEPEHARSLARSLGEHLDQVSPAR